MEIFALHGFLGRPSDWTTLFECSDLSIHTYDLFKDPPLPFSQWASKFNKYVRNITSKQNSRILLGYSLGSRLALYLLADDPELWNAAVFISAHPGLISQDEKAKRMEIDATWAGKFETLEWNCLMKEWNERDVFNSDTVRFDRLECDYSRKILSSVLKTWSLSQQKDFRKFLKEAKIPILWMTGSQDTTYEELASQVQLTHPVSRKCSINGAGHRVPWQKQQIFFNELHEFLDRLEINHDVNYRTIPMDTHKAL